ncbi:MAG: OmpH family outer membrane protein [Saprospiraceae bacterium]|nr:OmpH family outer membrane protein [Saprospiraceae bacterium]
MKKSIFLAISLFLTLGSTAYAQKFGYCNSTVLFTIIPEVKQADSELQGFQTQLTKKGQEMVQALQTKADDLKRKQDNGTISPKDAETQSNKLAEEEQVIVKYEQEVYQKLAQKRQELYQPILDRVNEAMKQVAIENGFALVFDTTSNVVLYADESLDVTKLVKAKLGITE